MNFLTVCLLSTSKKYQESTNNSGKKHLLSTKTRLSKNMALLSDLRRQKKNSKPSNFKVTQQSSLSAVSGMLSDVWRFKELRAKLLHGQGRICTLKGDMWNRKLER